MKIKTNIIQLLYHTALFINKSCNIQRITMTTLTKGITWRNITTHIQNLTTNSYRNLECLKKLCALLMWNFPFLESSVVVWAKLRLVLGRLLKEKLADGCGRFRWWRDEIPTERTTDIDGGVWRRWGWWPPWTIEFGWEDLKRVIDEYCVEASGPLSPWYLGFILLVVIFWFFFF